MKIKCPECQNSESFTAQVLEMNRELYSMCSDGDVHDSKSDEILDVHYEAFRCDECKHEGLPESFGWSHQSLHLNKIADDISV